MPNTVDRDEAVSVALLYQTSQLEGHLKDALKELGAAVVYEALTAQMDRDALEGSGAHVVIVNLDPEIESHLDEVYDLLDDERYNVVFNDAQVSSALSGWEQARWSRHLAAKIMGRPEVSDPPRPPGSQAPPSPAQKGARAIPDAVYSPPPNAKFAEDTAATAMFSTDTGLNDALDALFGTQAPAPAPARMAEPVARAVAPPAPAAAPAAPAASDFGFDFDDLLGTTASAPAAPSSPSMDADPFDATFDLDLDSLGSTPPAPAASAASSADAYDLDLNFDAPSLGVADDRTSVREMASDFGLDVGDFGNDTFGDLPGSPPSPLPIVDDQGGITVDEDFSFGAELDALFEAIPGDPPAPSEALVDFDAAFGTAAPAVNERDERAAAPSDSSARPATRTSTPERNVRAAPTSLSDWSLAPLSDDTPAPVPAPAAESAPASAESFGVQKMSAKDFLAGSDWSLEDLSAETPESAAKPAEVKASIEKLSASEFLAPEGGDASKFQFDTSLKLDLIPIEEAVAPREARPDLVVEHRLDGASVPRGIKRVVVLGASIGGPEAVREYLAALPARFPALFVLAQHMGAEFLELMAAQLAKATPLTVRAPGHGERVSHGEIVVVPTTHRLLIDAEGVVQLAHLPEASPYSPSIDLVVRDVADRFGVAATVIIFSGMAHDAIEGAKHLAEKGGKVWVQDPDTCVISSMVDGARDAGVVSFTGSPTELAKQTIAVLGKA